MCKESRLASSLKCLFKMVCYVGAVYLTLLISFLALDNKIIMRYKIIFLIILLVLGVASVLIMVFSKKVMNYENSPYFLREESDRIDPIFAKLYGFLRRFI